jgi:EmrB/QacA subfamily drug resistance transporter
MAEHPSARAAAAPIRDSRRWVVLAICCLSLLIVGLDTTIVNVALPAIHHSLHASVAGMQWTIDAYTLVLASLVILAGSTADRIGRRRVFQVGLLGFSAGSLLCGLAPSLTLLVGARVLQAIGGSMLNPVAMSIIRNEFEEPRERARAIGLWGAVFGLSLALGPVLGGVLVDSVGWRAVFFVNVPIGLAAIVLTALCVPESRAPRPRRLDPIGQLLVIISLGALTYAIIEGPRLGWGSAEILSLFAASAMSVVALIGYERRRVEPLLEVRFFRSVPFSGANTIALLTFAGLGGFLFLNTLYLQDVRNMSPLQAGLYLLPMAGMLFVFAPLSGRLVARFGARPSLVAGGAATAGAALMLTGLEPGTSSSVLFGAYFLFGIGMGLMNPPITNTAVSGMPGAQAGVAAAIASTSRQVGMTLGVAVIGAISGGSLRGEIGEGFASATHPGWWIIVALGALIVIGGLISTGAWAERTARRAAETLRPEPLADRYVSNEAAAAS